MRNATGPRYGARTRPGYVPGPIELDARGFAGTPVFVRVGRGKNANGHLPTWEMSVFDGAWFTHQYMTWARSRTRITALIVDCDYDNALHRLSDLCNAGHLPWPTGVVIRPDNGHLQAFWLYVEPVHLGPDARLKPQQAHWCLFRHYTEVLGGDHFFQQDVALNPAYGLKPGREITTKWLAGRAYEFDELFEFLPRNGTIAHEPAGRKSRKGSRFVRQMTRKWAGRPSHDGLPVIDQVRAINAVADDKLDARQIADMADEIEDERDGWRANGWHSDEYRAKMAAQGQKGGLASGRSRWRALSEPDEIMATQVLVDGLPKAEVARRHNCHPATVTNAIRRHQKRVRDGEIQASPERVEKARTKPTVPPVGEAAGEAAGPLNPSMDVSVDQGSRESRIRAGSGGNRPAARHSKYEKLSENPAGASAEGATRPAVGPKSGPKQVAAGELMIHPQNPERGPSKCRSGGLETSQVDHSVPPTSKPPPNATVPMPRLDEADPLETRREHKEWVRMRQREGSHHTAMLKRHRSQPEWEQIQQLRIEGKSERDIEQITKCSRGMVRNALAHYRKEIEFERGMAALRAAAERKRKEVLFV